MFNSKSNGTLEFNDYTSRVKSIPSKGIPHFREEVEEFLLSAQLVERYEQSEHSKEELLNEAGDVIFTLLKVVGELIPGVTLDDIIAINAAKISVKHEDRHSAVVSAAQAVLTKISTYSQVEV